MKVYYPTVNLLRALAALMVCLAHFFGYVDLTRGSLFPVDSWLYSISKSGLNGVYIFFVVSGFVIPLSLSKENYQVSRLHRFLSRRFIRIELPYIVSIGIVLLIRLIYAFKNQTPFEFNLEQIFYHIIYMIPYTKMEWFAGQYWTLAIEFQFYVLIGVIYALITSKNKIILYSSLLIFAGLNFVVTDDRFIFHYSILFVQGILLFLVKNEKMDQNVGWICIVISILATMYIHSIEIGLFCMFTVLAIQFLTVNHTITNRLGDISYSLYLIHVTIGGNLLYLFYKYFNGTGERILLVILVFVANLIFAYGFWWLIENPSKKLSRRIRV